MENKKGGKRNGAGRKALPIGDKREALIIYPMNKSIKKVGGIKTAKKLALAAIES